VFGEVAVSTFCRKAIVLIEVLLPIQVLSLVDQKEGKLSQLKAVPAPSSCLHCPRQKQNINIRSELKLFNLIEGTGKQKENWYEHILRMSTDRLPKIFQNYKPREYRTLDDPEPDGMIHFLEVGTGQ
jgi:hypothetical protein